MFVKFFFFFSFFYGVFLGGGQVLDSLCIITGVLQQFYMTYLELFVLLLSCLFSCGSFTLRCGSFDLRCGSFNLRCGLFNPTSVPPFFMICPVVFDASHGVLFCYLLS